LGVVADERSDFATSWSVRGERANSEMAEMLAAQARYDEFKG
jgi:hypothetical protein